MKYNEENIIGHELEAVRENGYNIRFITNPSEELQLEAVKQHYKLIKFIENPSKEVQLAAIDSHHNMYEKIKEENDLLWNIIKKQL